MSKRRPPALVYLPRRAVVAGLACTALTLPACTSDADSPPETTSTTQPESTTTTTTTSQSAQVDPDVREEVEGLISRSQDAIRDAAISRDPNHPGLAGAFSDGALTYWSRRIAELIPDGILVSAPAGNSSFAIQSIESGDQNLIVLGCLTDPLVQTSEADGSIIDDDVRHIEQRFEIGGNGSGMRISRYQSMGEVDSCG